ncbi:MAG TPA: AAA family ATPase, partial [Corynebacterium variabile]|nr:AAA family ATPase [Corynebacterium variabile]
MTLKIVVGPPAAGKSTWIREHRKPGDITIDYDVIANALAGAEPANHEHTDIIKQVTRAARIAAIDAAGKHTDSVDVWIIHSTAAASTLDRYREQGAEVIIVDPGRDIVMHRIKHERPKHMLAAAAKWYDTQAGGGRQGSRGKPPAATRPARSTSDRGYGWDHQQQRERLLKAHVDGTPCDWCGEPMYRDKAKNFDGAALEAAH